MSASAHDPDFLNFIQLFNEERFDESHEALLPAWQQDPRYGFYKALIQLAGALQHWNEGNAFWAADLFASSHNLLAKYAPAHQGLNIDRLLEEIRACHAIAVEAHQQGGERQLRTPRLVLLDGDSA